MDHPKFDSAVDRDKDGLKTTVSPLYLSYFMLDWESIAQVPTAIKCMTCMNPMSKAEPVRDGKDASFDGLVCHRCKTVIWSRRDKIH